jgi:hypothetical protein
MEKTTTTWIWRSSIVASFSILLAVGSYFSVWAFERLEAIPVIYETKENAYRNVEKFERQQEIIIKKIDEGFKDVNQKLFDLANEG